MMAYDGWAQFYDELLGEAGFGHIWPAFRRAARRFRMRIPSAADFGCGTGLFLGALARSKPEAALFGVDRSREMLRLAARRLAGRNVQLYRGDLRDILLPRRVDLVTCNFSTLNYFLATKSLKRAIKNLIRHMKFGGFLVIDLLSSGGNCRTQKFVQRISLPQMTGSWHIQGDGRNTRGRVVMRNCRCERGRWRCWTETHDQRWWPVAQVIHYLQLSGLAVLGVAPLGEVPPSRGGRWIQIVAQRG